MQVDAAESPQIRVLPGWGSWPVSHVRAMERLGLGAFWYTTGGAADVRKPAAPVVVAYGTGTAPTTTTTSTLPTTAAPTTAPPTTVPPTTVAPTTAPTAPTSEGPGVSAGVLSSSGASSSFPSSSSSSRRSSSGTAAGTGPSTGSTDTASTGTIADADTSGGELEADSSASASSVDDEPAETAELVFSELSASYDASLNPFSPGTMRLTYRVRNTSDVELRASRSATVTPAWGDEVTSVADDPLELGPGESATYTQAVPGVWPGGDTRSQVELDPTAVGDEPVRTRVAVARTTSALTPWPQITAALLALVLVVAAIALGMRTRRRVLSPPPTPSQHPTPWRTT